MSRTPKGKTLEKRASAIVDFQSRMDQRERVEAVKTARALALSGLPKRRTEEKKLTRSLRVGSALWLKVTYTADGEMPFGEDRFVLAGIQHLALEQENPIVHFDRVGSLLEMFGLGEDGRTISMLRDRFRRLAGLSVKLSFASTQAGLEDGNAAEQLFVIRRYNLPSRRDLRSERVGQLTIPGADDSPYGVELSADFWGYLQQRSNLLIVPIALLKMFIDRPVGWDYLNFLVARCGAAKGTAYVPQEALISMFRDSDTEPERNVIRRLQGYHNEIMLATNGRLNAEIVEQEPEKGSSGRPRKRWALRVGPSLSLLSFKDDKLLPPP